MVIPNFYGNDTLGFALHSPHHGSPGVELLYSRTDCLSRQCEESELPTNMNSWKRNKKGAIKPLFPVLTVLRLDMCSPTHHSPSWL
jgi:hypothetical protein